MSGLRRFYSKRWLAALMVLLAMALAASGGALLALESEAALRAQEAADLVAQANAFMVEGNVAQAGYTYIWVLDNYPDTLAKLDAHAALVELKSLVRNGTIDFPRFEAFIQVLPDFWSLSTLEAMNAVANMEHVYAGELLKMDRTEEARQVWRQTLDNAMESLRVYWYDPAAYSTPRIAVYMAKRLDQPEKEATIQELEEYVELAGPCMGSYGARAVLLEYYYHTGKRRARRPHIQPLIAEGASDYVLDALASPYVGSIQKAAMRFTNGYALMLAGFRNPEYLPLALAAYQELDADPTAEGTDFKEWAGHNIARTIRRMHKDNPQAGIAAYEDYLSQTRPPEPGGTEWRERKFANLARVELADMYIRLGEYDKAAAYAEQALLEEGYPEIVTMAEDCLRRVFEAQSQPQPEG